MPNKRLNKSMKRRSKSKKSLKQRKSISRKRQTRKRSQNGGLPSFASLTDALLARSPQAGTVPMNYLQTSALSSSGSTYVPASSSPTSPAFKYNNKGIDGLINPGKVTVIDNSFGELASPAPWQNYPRSGQPQPFPIPPPSAASNIGQKVAEAAIKAAGPPDSETVAYAKSALDAAVNNKAIPSPPESLLPAARGTLDMINRLDSLASGLTM